MFIIVLIMIVFVSGILAAILLTIRHVLYVIEEQLNEIQEGQDKILSKLNSIDKS